MKKPKLTPDAKLWWRKASTVIAAITTVTASVELAIQGMAWRTQELIPDWVLIVLAVPALLNAVLVPLATSWSQPGIEKRLN